jgi:hypothetical protein
MASIGLSVEYYKDLSVEMLAEHVIAKLLQAMNMRKISSGGTFQRCKELLHKQKVNGLLLLTTEYSDMEKYAKEMHADHKTEVVSLLREIKRYLQCDHPYLELWTMEFGREEYHCCDCKEKITDAVRCEEETVQ